MREIKFRGKQIYGNKFVYGYYVNACKVGEKIERSYILQVIDRRETGINAIEIEVDPATVGQYTGLKDKNGMEIYEGDVVITNKPSYDDKPHENIVVFEDASFRYRCDGVNDIPCGCYLSNEVEVIGNVHDPSARRRGNKWIVKTKT